MTLEELEQIVATRAAASPDESWTAKLLAKGPEKVTLRPRRGRTQSSLSLQR